MKCLMSVSFMILVGCGQPNAISYDRSGISSNMRFQGFLAANSCSGGASYVQYAGKNYDIGGRSTSSLSQQIQIINSGTMPIQPISGAAPEGGCVEVYPLEFNGEFEQETNPVGAQGTEMRNVIQVYQFRIPTD